MILPEWAADYVSLPYDEVDCWGLCKLVYFERYQLKIGDIEEQRGRIRKEEWRDILQKRLPILEGDILLFKSGPVTRHVGILINYEYMLHSTRPIGVVIEKWTRRQWKTQLTAIYRHSTR
jgi:cell wall-associated NlpC family hydrolase